MFNTILALYLLIGFFTACVQLGHNSEELSVSEKFVSFFLTTFFWILALVSSLIPFDDDKVVETEIVVEPVFDKIEEGTSKFTDKEDNGVVV